MSDADNTVDAVVVNYQTADFLPDLIDELNVLGNVAQVFVVDNSGELTQPFLCQRLPRQRSAMVKLLSPGTNIGFGAGVNLAAQQAGSNYLLVINPDVRLFPGCLEHLLAAARLHGSVLTGPRFYWDAERRYRLPPSQGTSAWMDYALAAAPGHRLEREHVDFYWQIRHERYWNASEPFSELFLSGACLLIHRQWGLQRGADVFDESFFLYFEDNDISLRAWFDGVPPLCVPAAEALHYYDQSPSPDVSKGELMGRSHGAFAAKYYGKLAMPDVESASRFPECHDLGPLTSPPKFNLDEPLVASDGWHAGLDVPSPSATVKDGGTRVIGPEVGTLQPTSLFFEIGVTPLFVPFAQTLFSAETSAGKVAQSKTFRFDEEIWNRMANGTYFGRVRDQMRGTLKRWKWEKV